MHLKKILLATCAMTIMGVTSGHAEGISANVGFVTDYVYRGISRTDENPAIQGGFDYEDPTGLHAGVWGSNVDFNNSQDGSLELDMYAGYANEIGNFNYDIGGIYYAFPGSEDNLNYDYWEVYATAGYQFNLVDLSFGINYSPDFFGDTGDATYIYGGIDWTLPYDFSAKAHIGYQEIDQATDYTDWALGLGYNWLDFDFALTYTGTDRDVNDWDDDRLILGVSRKF